MTVTLREGGDPQTVASDPGACAFVEANAGSGKTSTLVRRVARLLLAGARPEAILCVTFTKAAAAEMQSRLFATLGDWAVMQDGDLADALARIDEAGRDLSRARALFARALETPGGLKIQTIHAFCERVLRRFPIESGVSPAFKVLDDAGAADLSTRARDETALLALGEADSLVGRAYAHLAVELDWGSFNEMLAMFAGRRDAIAAYVNSCGGDCAGDVWRRCGLEAISSQLEIETEALARIRWTAWRRAAEGLGASPNVSDQTLAAKMLVLGPGSSFNDVWSLFSIQNGEIRKKLTTTKASPETQAWMLEEQDRLRQVAERLRAAKIAEDTVHVLVLAQTYASLYEDEKSRLGVLDFGDLTALTARLLTERADAAWVLFKLDGGVDHLLLDEAQDTAPDQWDILRALTEEFFSGHGAGPKGRTIFAVGDEKQSIFSFQGAAPERLGLETQAFSRMAKAAGARFDEVKLLESWRSTEQILSFVDAVFAGGPALAGVRPARGVERFPLRHTHRRPEPGRVDLWPLEADQPGGEIDPWAPVDAQDGKSAIKLLAQRIADHIAACLAQGLAVWDRGGQGFRPCRPKDFLILVRRRNALFHEIIRALKRAGVPVGGPDRLALSEHGIFQDIVVLAQFALFPDDDLALAGVLRGPFCEVDEEGLFDLAHDRTDALWATLRRRAPERAPWREAAALMTWACDVLPRFAPFDGFSRFLSRLDADGRSMRQRLLTRLGAEGEDALEAFLSQVLDAEGRGVHDLESLIAHLAGASQQIKRDPEGEGRGAGEVRVMTTHGAKGLESPVVILPDTSTRATSQGSPLLDLPGGGFAWAPRKGDDCEVSAAAREERDRQTAHESARLLYVALTRARDWLIIAGVETGPAFFQGSWRALVEDAFAGLETRAVPLAGGGVARRYGPDPATADRVLDSLPAQGDLPEWVEGLAPAEGRTDRRVSPSSLIDGGHDRTEAPSPLASGGLGRYRRGDLIHGLLQRLPDLAPAVRRAAAHRLLDKERDLTPDQRAEIAAAALTLLEDPRFAPVFGPGSRAEVAVAGMPAAIPGLSISGRIDRLVVEADRVLIVDFKTNRPAPAKIEDADGGYVAQMAAYAAILTEIYPERTIEAALVWTDGPSLMPVPQALMRAALARLG